MHALNAHLLFARSIGKCGGSGFVPEGVGERFALHNLQYRIHFAFGVRQEGPVVVKVPSQGLGIELLCAQFVNRNVGTIIVVGVGIFCHGGILGLCAYPCVGRHIVLGNLSFICAAQTVVRNHASYFSVDVSGSHHVILYERWGIVFVNERYHAIGVVALASFNSTSEEVLLYCSAVYSAQHAASLKLARLDARIREAVGNGATLIAIAHLGLRYFASDGSHVVASFNVRV